MWTHLEEMDEADRIQLLEDKRNPLWDVECPLSLACWLCTRWGFPIIFNYPRFWGVPLVRVHNFHANARAIAKYSSTGVWNERDNWTMRWNPVALKEIVVIAKDLRVSA